MTDRVKHNPNLPALSPMYTCLWTLIVPLLETKPHANNVREIRVITNRIALFSYTYNGEAAWLHLCTPKKLYNQLKRHYDYNGAISTPTLKLPMKAEVTFPAESSSFSSWARISINNTDISIGAVRHDIERSCAINEALAVECWGCGALLKSTEKLMINLHYIGSKV